MPQSLSKIYVHLVFSTKGRTETTVVAYIKGQEEHHKKVSFQDEFRKICQLYKAELDERYAWD
jgi:GrpB-like predicted nucleotidyltransferase (UPF0157 family)